MATPVADRVLSVAPPSFSPAEAAAIARDVWGVEGVARAAESERDQTFLIEGGDPAVLKISNVAEDPARLDMELMAARRVALVDPALPVARQRPVRGAPTLPDNRTSYRIDVPGRDGLHQARLFDRLPGRASIRGAELSDAAVRGWASAAARLGRALRGFNHPAAARVMLWDVQHALALRELLPSVADHDVRALVERTLDRYEAVVAPVWPSLRAQVVHTDLSADNVLVDGDGSVTGIIDFGDMTFSALVADLAAVLRSLVAGRSGDEVFRTIRIALDGYERVMPLEPGERAIVGELLGARAAASIVVPAARAGLYDGAAPMAGLRRDALELLRLLDATGWEELARRLGVADKAAPGAMPGLVRRRARLLEPAVAPLAYAEPLHLVRGEGVWLFDADGRRYLDAYNNVPVVGHAHPRVTGAIARQARRLNTNLRYLHETALDVADRLTAMTPGLDVVLFVNSGSEANDIAWRIATAATGHTGGLCTDNAYHGVTEAIAALSPENETAGREPDQVRRWRPSRSPDDDDRALADFAAAVGSLRQAGHGLAASIVDGVLTSDGILELRPAVAAELIRATHDAGGLWIADEVQGGHGRTGTMWSYERLGIVPDVVTLGKPMGNGHPVAAVITRRELAERFASTTDFFSTFGGNPVAMAAALAVLDVIADERILDNARTIGGHLRTRLREVAAGSDRVGDVRGIGLATGVDTPDRATTVRIVNELRRRGVLIGRTGQRGDVLKIRPPLVFGPRDVEVLVGAFADVVGGLGEQSSPARRAASRQPGEAVRVPRSRSRGTRRHPRAGR